MTGNRKGLDAQLAPRLSRMFAFLDAVQTIADLKVPPNYDAHELKGNRAGTWSLTVTRNWRMTFRVTEDLGIEDMDLEDYHGA
nr:type II toxin-antitoxin system RelE/ParE family toxin [Sphingomonas vulcanisoli]